MGVETPKNFSSCDSDVGRAFNQRLDKYVVPSQFYVASLLDRGVRMLIYSGTYDWQCGWHASKLWLEKLEWTGNARYNLQGFHDWAADGCRRAKLSRPGRSRLRLLMGRDI